MSTTADPQVVYVCLRCRAYFAVPARSRRRYCPTCETLLEHEGWKQRKAKAGETNGKAVS